MYLETVLILIKQKNKMKIVFIKSHSEPDKDFDRKIYPCPRLTDIAICVGGQGRVTNPVALDTFQHKSRNGSACP